MDDLGIWRYVWTGEPLGGPGASDTPTSSGKKEKKKQKEVKEQIKIIVKRLIYEIKNLTAT